MFALTVLIAHSLQKSIHDSNGVSYDIERQKLGIYAIGQFERFEESEWEHFYHDDIYRRWKGILVNTELANEYHYYYQEKKDTPYHKSKRIVYGTQLLFWQNYHGAELDMFIKPIDSLRHIELEVIYISNEMETGGNFYAYIDTIDENAPELFFCGTEDVEDIERDSISKKESDEILKKWGL